MGEKTTPGLSEKKANKSKVVYSFSDGFISSSKVVNPLETKHSKSILNISSFPYLFTLIVAFISFQYNQISDEIKNSPFMQYKIELDSTKTALPSDTTYYTCSVKNICKTRFKSLQFVFTFKQKYLRNRFFMFPSTEPIHPASLRCFKDTVAAGQIATIFIISNFQPETSYKFHFIVSQPTSQILNPYLYINSDENVILKSPSLFTWCTQNQLLLNAVILLFLFTVLTVYFIYLNNTSYEGKAD